MEFQDLEGISIIHLNHTFNQAFSDYVLPMHVTVKQLAENIRRDGINFRYSVGAFADGQLVGFILQSLEEWNGVKTAYNGGTGVIPAFRGNKITRRLYEYSIPHLQAAGMEQCLLEVIATNQVAIRTYQAVGFEQHRRFTCYKADLKDIPFMGGNQLPGIDIREITMPDWNLVQQFWDYSPSWQYAIPSIRRLIGKISVLGAFEEEQLVGYAAVIRNTNRVAQFAVAKSHRGRGIGQGLFYHLARNASGPLVVINVDESHEATNEFLKATGFTCFIKQLEMIRPLK
jgi:ribosomal protein S18 acetylase RimI-like enzyme